MKKKITKLKKELKSEIQNFFDTLIICFAIVVLTFIFIGQPVEVNGASMEPNFSDGERILAEKVSTKINEIERGEVVILKHPKEPSKFVIKRTVGLPGETLVIRDGNIYINNKLLEEPYLNKGTVTIGMNAIKENAPEKIPAGNYLVFGDNRSDSFDSRSWGFVEEGSIIGKAVFVYYPLEKMRTTSL